MDGKPKSRREKNQIIPKKFCMTKKWLPVLKTMKNFSKFELSEKPGFVSARKEIEGKVFVYRTRIKIR